MAKKEAEKLAYTYYVIEGLNAKVTATKVHVTARTVQRWASVNNWDKLRTAKHAGTEQLLDSYQKLLKKLVEKRLDLEENESEEKESAKGLIDEISKINKAIENLQKQDKPSLRTHIRCVEGFIEFLLPLLVDADLSKSDLIDYTKEYFTTLAETN